MADQTRKLLLTISVVVKNLDRETELQRVATHLQEVHGHIRIQEVHIEAFLESLHHAISGCMAAAFRRMTGAPCGAPSSASAPRC